MCADWGWVGGGDEFDDGGEVLEEVLIVVLLVFRTCLLIVNAMAVVATLLLGVKNFEFFVVARLFQGFTTGLLSSIAPLMMK